eukprot:m.21963 g.21963  ORF g.21963 m.21963 type:complete len:546 (-) comp5404_c0_seq1:550-2187(-)
MSLEENLAVHATTTIAATHSPSQSQSQSSNVEARHNNHCCTPAESQSSFFPSSFSSISTSPSQFLGSASDNSFSIDIDIDSNNKSDVFCDIQHYSYHNPSSVDSITAKDEIFASSPPSSPFIYDAPTPLGEQRADSIQSHTRKLAYSSYLDSLISKALQVSSSSEKNSDMFQTNNTPYTPFPLTVGGLRHQQQRQHHPPNNKSPTDALQLNPSPSPNCFPFCFDNGANGTNEQQLDHQQKQMRNLQRLQEQLFELQRSPMSLNHHQDMASTFSVGGGDNATKRSKMVPKDVMPESKESNIMFGDAISTAWLEEQNFQFSHQKCFIPSRHISKQQQHLVDCDDATSSREVPQLQQKSSATPQEMFSSVVVPTSTGNLTASATTMGDGSFHEKGEPLFIPNELTDYRYNTAFKSSTQRSSKTTKGDPQTLSKQEKSRRIARKSYWKRRQQQLEGARKLHMDEEKAKKKFNHLITTLKELQATHTLLLNKVKDKFPQRVQRIPTSVTTSQPASSSSFTPSFPHSQSKHLEIGDMLLSRNDDLNDHHTY